MKKIEIGNMTDFYEVYGGNDSILITVDYHEELGGADIVAYDISDIPNLYNKEVDRFHEYLTDNGADEETYEINRWTLIKNN